MAVRDEKIYEYDGKFIIAKRYDPFGFIELTFAEEDHGDLPEELQGNFTTFDDVKRALDKYYNGK